MSANPASSGSEYRKCLLDLLGSIQNAQLALQRWDAAGFERAVDEQQTLCDHLAEIQPAAGDYEASAVVLQVRAALRSYHLVVERGSRWCRTLGRILGEPTTPPSVNLRPEL